MFHAIQVQLVWGMLHFFRNRIFAICLAKITPPCCIFDKLKHGGMNFRMKTITKKRGGIIFEFKLNKKSQKYSAAKMIIFSLKILFEGF